LKNYVRRSNKYFTFFLAKRPGDKIQSQVLVQTLLVSLRKNKNDIETYIL